MNFAEAVDNIVTRIKRPDKVLDCGDAINRAINLFGTSTWAADLVELTHTLAAPTSYVQAIDITASPFARFRKVKYIRPTGYRKYLTFRDSSRIWDHNCESTDVWYRGGNYIRFKLSALQTTAEMGYYQYHIPLADDADTDWMLDQMWPAIQSYALQEMFADIGNMDESAKHEKRWPVLLAAYKEDIGDGVSYA